MFPAQRLGHLHGVQTGQTVIKHQDIAGWLVRAGAQQPFHCQGGAACGLQQQVRGVRRQMPPGQINVENIMFHIQYAQRTAPAGRRQMEPLLGRPQGLGQTGEVVAVLYQIIIGAGA